MSKAAPVAALEALHAAVAEALAAAVREGDMKAMASAIKFLKDNGIEAAKGSDNTALRKLTEQLSQLDMANDPDADDAFLN